MTEEGLEVNYDMVVYQYRELWPYDQIEDIHKELSPDGTKMALHVMKDVMSRKLIYDLDVYKDVIALALEKNPKSLFFHFSHFFTTNNTLVMLASFHKVRQQHLMDRCYIFVVQFSDIQHRCRCRKYLPEALLLV